MKTMRALQEIRAIEGACERDSDAMFFCYFSREEDRYDGLTDGMDAGDTLILINELIKAFGLSPEAVAASCRGE